MAPLEPGKIAPEISLPNNQGTRFSLSQARNRGPVVVAFYKVSCPTCQLAFPFLERMHQAYGNAGYTMVGVSQNSPEDSQDFAKRFGVTFEQAFDDGKKYAASNAFGITNVPSIFVVSPAGKVEMTSVGWSREEIEALNWRLAEASGKSAIAVVRPSDGAPDFKPG